MTAVEGRLDVVEQDIIDLGSDKLDKDFTQFTSKTSGTLRDDDLIVLRGLDGQNYKVANSVLREFLADANNKGAFIDPNALRTAYPQPINDPNERFG
jgi:hypothetical protein